MLSKKTLLLLFFVALKMILQYFLVHPEYDLHRDEYLHLDQGRHLAWGFESVPPFTSWISWLIIKLGNGEFWVKFFPALFGALTLVVVWKATEALNGNLFALVLSATAVLFSVLLRVNLLYQPNSFDILCWTFLYFSLLRYIKNGDHKWLLIAAASFAIAFLNKYNIVFCLLGLIPAILLTKHRAILANRHFYIGVLLAALLVAPNLVWQYQQGFPVIHHMKTLSATQLVNVNRADFLKEQLLYFLGSFFIFIAAFISFFKYAPFRKFQVFLWSLVFTLLIFIYFRAKGYYAIGLYPIFIAFGSVYIEQLIGKRWRVYLRPLCIVVILLLFIPFFKIAFPILSPEATVRDQQWSKALGLLRWEDGKEHLLPQDYADMLGWRELAAKVDSAYNRILNKKNTLVLCDNYGQAGAINYYSAHSGIGAVSMNADYINWFPLHQKKISTVILVKDINDSDKERTRERQLFRTVILCGNINNPFAREKGTSIYLLLDPIVSINQLLQQEIERERGKNKTTP